MKIQIKDDNIDLTKIEVGKEYNLILNGVDPKTKERGKIFDNDRVIINNIDLENKEIDLELAGDKIKQAGIVEMFDSNGKK